MQQKSPALYRRILGTDYDRMPLIIQRMHDVDAAVVARGTASIYRPASILGRLAGNMMGMPSAGTDLAAHVTFITQGQSEIIRREYGGMILETIQREGTGYDASHLIEQYGPVRLIIRLAATCAGLQFELVRVRMFGIPLPRVIWPELIAREWVENGWYRFSVSIALPLIGHVVRYQGRLKVVD